MFACAAVDASVGVDVDMEYGVARDESEGRADGAYCVAEFAAFAR